GDPQLDRRRRRGRAFVARMVAVRAGIPHPGRDRHRARLRLLDVIDHRVSWIDLSICSRPRRFDEPFFKTTENVGIQSCAWAFLFWRKGARGLALLMPLSLTPLFGGIEIGQRHFSIWFFEIPYISALIWAIWVVMAPVLLVLHYRRKGWLEVP